MNHRLTFLIATLIALTTVSSPIAPSVDDQIHQPDAAAIEVDQVISATGSGTT
jgi:hypothetical protein